MKLLKTYMRKDGSKVHFYELQKLIREEIYRKIGHWQKLERTSFRRKFAWKYFTGSYVFPVIPFLNAL